MPIRRKKQYPGLKEAEEQRKVRPEAAEEPDFIGNAPNYDKFVGWSAEKVLAWLNVD